MLKLNYQASISVNGNIHTISNDLGQFCVTGDEDDVVKISYIGYESRTFSLKTMPSVIKMKQCPIVLDEVAVIPLDRIIKTVMARNFDEINVCKERKSNFFYRQTTSTSGETNEFVEAFFEGKCAFAMRDVRLINGRYACLQSDSSHFYSNVNNYWDYSRISPISKKVVKGSVILPFTPQYKKLYTAEYSIVTDNEGARLYKITMLPKKHVKTAVVKGTVWIDAGTMQILKFSGEILNATAGKGRVKMPIYTLFDCVYSHDKGFTEVSSIRTSSTYNYQGHHVAVRSIMFNIGNRRFNGKKKMGDHTSLREKILSLKYDSKYWNDDAIIKQTPIESGVIKMFEEKNLFCNYNK